MPPSTFQGLMNNKFRPYLRKFVLVFFDDILVYSKIVGEHVGHLKTVLKFLQHHQLYAKFSKCVFECQEVEYLGHVISKRVKADPSKILSMLEWTEPKNPKVLRGFMGLTGYYRLFVKGYGSVATSLTALVKRNSFK